MYLSIVSYTRYIFSVPFGLGRNAIDLVKIFFVVSPTRCNLPAEADIVVANNLSILWLSTWAASCTRAQQVLLTRDAFSTRQNYCPWPYSWNQLNFNQKTDVLTSYLTCHLRWLSDFTCSILVRILLPRR